MSRIVSQKKTHIQDKVQRLQQYLPPVSKPYSLSKPSLINSFKKALHKVANLFLKRRPLLRSLLNKPLASSIRLPSKRAPRMLRAPSLSEQIRPSLPPKKPPKTLDESSLKATDLTSPQSDLRMKVKQKLNIILANKALKSLKGAQKQKDIKPFGGMDIKKKAAPSPDRVKKDFESKTAQVPLRTRAKHESLESVTPVARAQVPLRTRAKHESLESVTPVARAQVPLRTRAKHESLESVTPVARAQVPLRTRAKHESLESVTPVARAQVPLRTRAKHESLESVTPVARAQVPLRTRAKHESLESVTPVARAQVPLRTRTKHEEPIPEQSHAQPPITFEQQKKLSLKVRSSFAKKDYSLSDAAQQLKDKVKRRFNQLDSSSVTSSSVPQKDFKQHPKKRLQTMGDKPEPKRIEQTLEVKKTKPSSPSPKTPPKAMPIQATIKGDSLIRYSDSNKIQVPLEILLKVEEKGTDTASSSQPIRTVIPVSQSKSLMEKKEVSPSSVEPEQKQPTSEPLKTSVPSPILNQGNMGMQLTKTSMSMRSDDQAQGVREKIVYRQTTVKQEKIMSSYDREKSKLYEKKQQILKRGVKLSYLFENMPESSSFSKFKTVLRSACKYAFQGQLEEGLNLFKTIREQKIPDEYKKMIDVNISDIEMVLSNLFLIDKEIMQKSAST